MPETQKCNVCARDFERAPEFWHRQSKAESGLSETCKACALERSRTWYRDNRQRALDGAREYRAKNPENLAERKRLDHITNRDRNNARSKNWTEANKQLLKQKHREYRTANREKVAERKRLDYFTNREARSATNRAWALANAERIRANKADYYQRNAERLKKKQRDYAAANAEKVAECNRRGHVARREHSNARDRAWKAANPERVRASILKYKGMRRGALGRLTVADIDAQYERQRGTCFYCPRSLAHGHFHADHYIPLSRGGSNEPSNIVLACPGCNLAKGRKLPGDFKPPK